MLRYNSFFTDISILGIVFYLCTSCDGSKEKERPSPLRMDSTEVAGINLKVTYSSPAVRERKIWGGLEPYHKVWRIGANKATIFETSDSISVSGNIVPRGKYSVFAITDSAQWTIIFNRQWDQWGAYDYHQEDDLFRVFVTPNRLDSLHERLSFSFEDQSLQFRWEYLGFELPITLPVPNQ